MCYLQCQQQEERLNTVESSVDKVAHEEIVCVGDVTADFEQLLEVVELTVNVAADLQPQFTTRRLIRDGKNKTSGLSLVL